LALPAVAGAQVERHRGVAGGEVAESADVDFVEAAAADHPEHAEQRIRGARYRRCGVRPSMARPEVHLSHRSNWLRAAVLGANDGILSTASLVLGVAASGASGAAIVTAGIAGLVAGALSMAAGEYVSVSSQRDAEVADMRLEARELRSDPEGELRELAAIYEHRGLPPALANEVALSLSRRGGALAAHARDELGLDDQRLARPFQAAWTSALSFVRLSSEVM
jgi:VIT1/CCC1 family predicted Fe2+/Mn2+ transporter